ncbi:MAG: BCAM0308 family protein [Burkholderiaceae bacterium]
MAAPQQPPVSTFRPGRHFEVFDGAIEDPYQLREKLSEPTVCADCGAVYHDGRWQWMPPPDNASQSRCPACMRIQEEMPAGYLTITGNFAMTHRDEIISMARHIEAREKKEHPLKRIMHIDQQPDQLIITTTDIHLVRELGDALEHAYKGNLKFQYSAGEYRLRMTWEC